MKTFLVVALLMFAVSSNGDPAVTSIAPASGLASGGDFVHIHGSDLQLVPLPCFPPCALKVTFGGVEAPVVSDATDEIIVIAPPQAAGSVDVQVVLLTKGTVTIANGYRYEDPPPSDKVRFLAPVTLSAPGAGGSQWVSELTITNESVENVVIGDTTILPQTTKALTLATPNVGAFFSIPKRLTSRMIANLRVHDQSRDTDNWGAEIPVVPETQFRPTVVIPNVPADARFRTLLRIYGYTPAFLNASVTLRDEATGAFLTTQTVSMTGGVTPTYTQLALDPIIAPFAAAHSRVRVEVTSEIVGSPSSPSTPLWAFVAVTNNATQQVTTLTPSPIPTTASTTPLALGHWAAGGNCMDVGQSDVTFTSNCAFGRFVRPLAIHDGLFEANGTYMFVGGIPTPNPLVEQVHYSGVLQGNDLQLIVTHATGPAAVIHFTFGSTESCTPPCP